MLSILFYPLVFTHAQSSSSSEASSQTFHKIWNPSGKGTAFVERYASDNQRSIFFGHNLTSAAYTFRSGGGTVGTYGLGYGITEAFTLGTSPWLIAAYNMPLNLSARWVVPGTISEDHQLMIEGNYFKTADYQHDQNPETNRVYRPVSRLDGAECRSFYCQDSMMVRAVWGQHWSRFYTLHVALIYMYFWDETRPFSLRMEPKNADPYSLSVGTLHELRLTRFLGAAFETGVLGVNYQTPYLHYGASVRWQVERFLLQLGVSHTLTLATLRGENKRSIYDNYAYGEEAIHPEIQAQWYF